MNPYALFNPVYIPDYYHQYYMNYYLQQQQMIQYMHIQQQCPTIVNQGIQADNPQIHITQEVKDQLDPKIQTKNLYKTNLTEQDQQSEQKSIINEVEELSRINGHWTKAEHQLYLEFVKNHDIILRSKYDKKSKKIFKLMSQFIPTRTATQCRSHHQKFNPLQKAKKKQKSNIRQLPQIVEQRNPQQQNQE